MTKKECAIVTAYTGINMLNGKDLGYLYEYLSDKVGRPLYTHELIGAKDMYKDEIREDFLTLCKEAIDD